MLGFEMMFVFSLVIGKVSTVSSDELSCPHLFILATTLWLESSDSCRSEDLLAEVSLESFRCTPDNFELNFDILLLNFLEFGYILRVVVELVITGC